MERTSEAVRFQLANFISVSEYSMKIQGCSRKYSFVQDILCKTITLVPKVKFHLKSSSITCTFRKKCVVKTLKILSSVHRSGVMCCWSNMQTHRISFLAHCFQWKFWEPLYAWIIFNSRILQILNELLSMQTKQNTACLCVIPKS